MALSPLSWLVLNATANDYEEIGTIMHDVGAWCLQNGTPYSEKGLLDALVGLINDGLLTAYRLSPDAPPIRMEVASPLDITAGTYFLATPVGRIASSQGEGIAQ